MSFSSLVKNELCRLDSMKDCCLVSELAAVFRIGGLIRPEGNGNGIKIVTENAAFARKIFSFIKKVYSIYPEVSTRRSPKLKKHISYMIAIHHSTIANHLLDEIGILCKTQNKVSTVDYKLYARKILWSTCCKKSYLRGAFLAGGSVSDPEKTYHLELTSHSLSLALELSGLMNSFHLNSKVIKRKGSYVVYLKEGENIVDFLNIIGAHAALMELENIRILKEMRNNVNRIVNCETANLEKTVNASLRQIENIKYIKEHLGFEKLPRNLRQVAEIRLNYSEANLKELGEMLDPPLGKSGVNHRLRKLDQVAENIRNLKGEFE